MSEEIIRSVLVKAGFKTFFVFLVVTTLDYFVDESDLLDQVNDFGFKIWILIITIISWPKITWLFICEDRQENELQRF